MSISENCVKLKRKFNKKLESQLQQKEEKLLQSEKENSQYRIRIAQLTLKLMDKEQAK